jgi:DNA adenine methylase
VLIGDQRKSVSIGGRRKSVAPFLKWVGGKRQLLPVLRRFYPAQFGRYFEPFLGSGAVFFDLVSRGFLNDHPATISDDNADLIGCYLRVGDALEQVIAELERLAAGHAAGAREHYMRVRDGRFNPSRAAWRDTGGDVDRYPVDVAAMLIYLNRTGYNGLFRLNASGEYNVPPGRYDKPKILDRQALSLASAALSAPNVTILKSPFDRVLEDAREGDFAYFDPPYAPLSATANFRGYTGRSFSEVDQQRLQTVLIELARRKVHVVLSNSTAPDVTQLYETNPQALAAGLKAWRFPARRAVNSRADRRGAVQELVVSNLTPAAD